MYLEPHSNLWIDVVEFRSLTNGHRQDEKDLLIHAVELYRGAFLEGYYLRRSVLFEDWQSEQRETLESEYADVLDRLATLDEDSGRPGDAVRWVRDLLSLDATDESNHRRLMRLLSRMGRRGAALEQYKACKSVLSSELGCEPELLTCRLAEEIARGSSGLIHKDIAGFDAGPLSNVPAPPNRLIGRLTEVDEILKKLKEKETRILTLTGPAGTGKTRLALEVGARASNLFPGGIIFVDLSTLNDHERVVPKIFESLRLETRSCDTTENQVQLIAGYLGSRQLLLILDNFEQVLFAAHSIGFLESSCPELRLLVTSREPLCLSAELEYPVSPLRIPGADGDETTMDELAQVPSVRLFVERGRDARPGFQLTESNRRVITSICNAMDGLPLAIELATRCLRLFSTAELLAQLTGTMELADNRTRDLPPRQRSLHNTLDWSFNLLIEPEKLLFVQMSIFFGGCTLHAAESVCGRLVHESHGTIPSCMEALVRKNLVRRIDTGSESRFVMLATIQEYARMRLEQSSDDPYLRERLTSYYSEFAEAAEPELRGLEQTQWYDRLELERDNLYHVMKLLLERGDSKACLRVAVSLQFYWQRRAEFGEILRIIETAYRTVDWDGNDYDTALQARSLLSLGSMTFLCGRWDEALLEIGDSLILFRRLDDLEHQSEALSLTGVISRWLGEFALGMAQCRDSITIARKTGNPLVIGHSILLAYGTTGGKFDSEPPLGQLDEALSLLNIAGDVWGIAHTFDSLGDTYLELGQLESARSHYDEAIVRFAQLRDRWMSAWALEGLGRVALRQNRVKESAACTTESLGLFFKTGDSSDTAIMLHRIGLIAIQAGNQAEGTRMLGAAHAYGVDKAGLVETDEIAIRRTCQREWDLGLVMKLDEAVEFARSIAF